MNAWRERISVDPDICHGRVCIKGSRRAEDGVVSNKRLKLVGWGFWRQGNPGQWVAGLVDNCGYGVPQTSATPKNADRL